MSDISSDVSEFYEKNIRRIEDVNLVDRCLDKLITKQDVAVQEGSYQGVYHGLITEFDEEFVKIELDRLLDLLKEIIKDSSLHVIRRGVDIRKLFGISKYEGSFSDNESEFKSLDGTFKARLLRMALEGKQLLKNLQNVQTTEEKMTAILSFLLQVLNVFIEISEHLFVEERENGASSENNVGMRLVRTTSHVVGRIISHHTKKVVYKFEEDLGMLYDANEIPFHNWDRSIENRQAGLTLFPKTRKDIQKAVMYAKATQKRIKVAGTKHTWNDVFIDDSRVVDENPVNDIIMCMLPESVSNPLLLAELLEDDEGKIDYDILYFDALERELSDWGSELQNIELVCEMGEYAHVKIGPSTLNFQVLKWCVQNGYTIPLNVLMILNSVGGTTSMCCHGAGLQTKTMSDLVVEIEYINAGGNIQVVNDPDQLKAVAGSFGLFGVILSLTYRFPKMTYAVFDPKTPSMKEIIPQQESDASVLGDLIENNYFNEFFWFPGNGTETGFWMNIFDNNGKREHVKTNLITETTKDFQTRISFIFSLCVNVLQAINEILPHSNENPFVTLLESINSKVSSFAGVEALPKLDQPKTIHLTEALHFHRGIHYSPPQNCMEIHIPIPLLPDNKRDWSIASRAWWDIITIYETEQENNKKSTQSLMFVLEMRIIGGSDCFMAPNKGNKNGTVTIEMLSTKLIKEEIWEDFMSKVSSKILSYTDHDNNKLNTRFHWAKQIPKHLTINGEDKEINEVLKETYADEMESFCQIMDEISPGGRKAAFKLFGNNYWSELFSHQLK